MQKPWTIIGTGAMACLWAAYLTQAGHTVTMIPRKVNHFKSKTLSIQLPNGSQRTFMVDIEDASSSQKIERAIVCTKAYDVQAALKSIETRLSENSFVLCCQNGLGIYEQCAKEMPQIPLFFASMTHGANKPSIDTVIHAGQGLCIFGPYQKANITLQLVQEQAIEALLALPLSVSYVDDIYPVLLRKLAINSLINPLTCLLDAENGVILSAQLRTLLIDLSEEFAQVFEFEAQQVFADALHVAELTQANVSSMLQDRRQNKRTEIDFINGYIVAKAQEKAIDAPINRSLLALIKALPNYPSQSPN